MIKRKFTIILIPIIIFLIVMFLFNIGLINNFGKGNILKEFANNLIKNNKLLTGSFDEYGYYSFDGKYNIFDIDNTGYNGILSIYISDLDKDGEEELWVVSLESEDEDTNKLKLAIYKDIEGIVKRIASMYLIDNIHNANDFKSEICIKKIDTGTMIYFEDNANASIFVDGYSWYFSSRSLPYGGKNIYKEYNGTDCGEEDQAECLKVVRGTGLNANSLLCKPFISSQDNTVKKLCSIERESTENISISNKEISKYMDKKTVVKDLRMKYGKTTFYNYIDLKEFK